MVGGDIRKLVKECEGPKGGGYGGNGRLRTFTEVVSGGGPGGFSGAKVDAEESINVKEANWDGARDDASWLSKCAVGTLMRFDKVSKVNQHLANRGITFNSLYIGEKFILWRFNSEQDCEFFIKNSFIWEDSFLSMEQWSSSMVASSRLAWINIMGVPLCHWNSEFFIQMGNEIGESLLVDDDTLFKRKLFKGRVLVLIKQGIPCPKFIIVNGKVGKIQLTMEEENTPVELQWVEEFLELVDEKMKSWEIDCGKQDPGNSIGQPPNLVQHDVVEVYGDTKKAWQITRYDRNQSLGMLDRCGNSNKGKSKVALSPFPNRLFPIGLFSNLNHALVLRNSKTVGASNDQVSSSSSDIEVGPFKNSVMFKGECSAQNRVLNDENGEGSKVNIAFQDSSTRDLVDGLGSFYSGPVVEIEPKGVGFHIDLCNGFDPNQKDKETRRKGCLKVRFLDKEAKKAQLMMKRGLLMSNLVHKRNAHHRFLTADRKESQKRKGL
ncbi:hypothetical protein Q3G72_032449 [Acer saccharum]|nr:hypothetical protein Q3G72_032449 [Acer saccharum]